MLLRTLPLPSSDWERCLEVPIVNTFWTLAFLILLALGLALEAAAEVPAAFDGSTNGLVGAATHDA